MNHPIVHAEIRSSDPDATRAFFGELFVGPIPPRGPSRATPSSRPECPRAVHRHQPAPGRRGPRHLLRRRRGHGGVDRGRDAVGRPGRAGAGHRARRGVRADRRPAGPHRGAGPTARPADGLTGVRTSARRRPAAPGAGAGAAGPPAGTPGTARRFRVLLGEVEDPPVHGGHEAVVAAGSVGRPMHLVPGGADGAGDLVDQLLVAVEDDLDRREGAGLDGGLPGAGDRLAVMGHPCRR